MLNDTFSKFTVARYGGEEFIVIMAGMTPAFCLKFIERFKAMVEESVFEIAGQTIKITVSVGVTNNTELKLIEIINEADVALYKAKQQGRNRVVCS